MITLQDIQDFEAMLAERKDHEIVEVTVGRLRPFILQAREILGVFYAYYPSQKAKNNAQP